MALCTSSVQKYGCDAGRSKRKKRKEKYVVVIDLI